MITNRPAYHPDFPPSSKYVRATLLLVGNIIEPILGKENEQHTRLTQVAHINPGGAADTSAAAFVINKLCAVGPPSFIKKLEAAGGGVAKHFNATGLKPNSSTETCRAFFEKILNENVERTMFILTKRIDYFGIAKPNVRKGISPERIRRHSPSEHRRHTQKCAEERCHPAGCDSN